MTDLRIRIILYDHNGKELDRQIIQPLGDAEATSSQIIDALKVWELEAGNSIKITEVS